MSQQKSAVYFSAGDQFMCYLLADFSTICMCLFFSDEISHYPLNYSAKQGEMTVMTASPIGLYFEKRTRPTCVTPSPGRVRDDRTPSILHPGSIHTGSDISTSLYEGSTTSSQSFMA